MGVNPNEAWQKPCKDEPPQLEYKRAPLSDDCGEAEARAYIENYLYNYPLSPLYHDESTRHSVAIGELGIPFSDRPFKGIGDKEGFKHDIKQLLTFAGCTMSDVAEMMEVNKSTVSRWISKPDMLNGCTAYNLFNTLAALTCQYGCDTYCCTPDMWYMRVGDIARKYIPAKTSEEDRRWDIASFTVQRLMGVLDVEAVELLAQTARALIGGHVPPEFADKLDGAERDIELYAARVNFNK